MIRSGRDSTANMTDHLVFVLQYSSNKQVATLEAVLDEAELLVQANCSTIVGVHAEVHLRRTKDRGCVAQRVTHDLSTDSTATGLRGDVDASDERLMSQLGHGFALQPHKRAKR